MNKLLKIIDIEQLDIDYLQFTKYEVLSYEQIVKDIIVIKNPEYVYSKENYDHFMREYKEAVTKNELAIQALLLKYAPEYDNQKYSYNFRFDNNTLEIYEIVNKGACSCENK